MKRVPPNADFRIADRIARVRRSAVLRDLSSPLPNASEATETVPDYFATEAHYLSLANRIAAALRAGGKVILLTGDPPPTAHLLTEALCKSTQDRYEVIDIVCRADLAPEDLSRAHSNIAAPPPNRGPAALSETSEPRLSLFVFIDLDQLAHEQIRELLQTTRHSGREAIAALLLTGSGFLTRLQEPSFQFLREQISAQFAFQEIGQEEGIEFLRHQLAARHARSEACGIPASVFRGLAALAVLLIIGIGAFLFLQSYQWGSERPERAAPGFTPKSEVAEAQSAGEAPTAFPPTAPVAAPALPPEQGLPTAASRDASLPAMASGPGQRLSTAEIVALVNRGDGFLNAGDIASARGFYERAANAGDGSAALRLGATFDPGFLRRAGVRGIRGDTEQAASWYRRARDLGDPAAVDRLKDLDRQSSGVPNSSSR